MATSDSVSVGIFPTTGPVVESDTAAYLARVHDAGLDQGEFFGAASATWRRLAG